MSYYCILTTLGLQRLAEAQYSGIPLVFTHFAVGDGNGSPVTPSAGATALVNETWRGSINGVTIHPSAANTIRVEALIPAGSGGFTIREAGLFNADDELIAVASYPATYKPNLADGVTCQEYLRILIEYAAVEAVDLTVDTSVIMATREYVDNATAGGLALWESFT